MIKYLIFFSVIFLTYQCTKPQVQQKEKEDAIAIEAFANLPKKLDESSGLEKVKNLIYSMNDSGGKAELFVFDAKGNKEQKIKITNAKNYDWESLAANSTHFFIGDFGNNSGNRENLAVFYFPVNELNKNEVEVNEIKFRYANQTNYFHKSREHSFDGEALIALENELIIFSKDWVQNATQVYHLPLDSKEETVMISPSEKMEIGALITGADYDAKNQRLVLCGYKNDHNFLWVFEGATAQKFLTKNFRKIELNGLKNAQVEGVTFLNESTILFSTEETKEFDAQMWTVDVAAFGL